MLLTDKVLEWKIKHANAFESLVANSFSKKSFTFLFLTWRKIVAIEYTESQEDLDNSLSNIHCLESSLGIYNSQLAPSDNEFDLISNE